VRCYHRRVLLKIYLRNRSETLTFESIYKLAGRSTIISWIKATFDLCYQQESPAQNILILGQRNGSQTNLAMLLRKNRVVHNQRPLFQSQDAKFSPEERSFNTYQKLMNVTVCEIRANFSAHVYREINISRKIR